MYHDSITLCQRRVSWRRLVKKTSSTTSKRLHSHPCSWAILQLPQPKFARGQHVCHQWTNEDDLDPNCGTTYRDYGVIVGLLYDIRNRYVSGWVYQISFSRIESLDCLELPYLDEVEESDLQAV
jgi:hypothetical protein